MDIPKVPWRFGEEYLVTDFITPNNIAVQELAGSLSEARRRGFIPTVSTWNRDNLYYPLDNGGNPSASGQFLRHQQGFRHYHAKNCVYYAWSLPNEVLGFTKCGICIDTANLVCSLLRVKPVEGCWAVLGDVKSSKDNHLLGRHAWVEVPYEEAVHVIETTIHEPGTLPLVLADEIYDRDSDWAQAKGLYYVVQARYNEEEWRGEGPLAGEIVELFGLPAKRVLVMGIEKTKELSGQKKLYKEWRQEMKYVDRLLLEAYRG